MEILSFKKIRQKYLFKFLSEENLKKFLEAGDRWFSPADIFGDRMECVLIADLQENPIDQAKIESRKKRTLISCWHLADQESLAMWDTYSKTKSQRRVCAIRFNVKHLNKLVKATKPNLPSAEL